MPPLLEVRDLHTEFRTGAGIVRAVDGVSYTVDPGETVAIVGESGSGKSVGALSLLRLIPDPPGRITQGQVLFAGRDLMRLSEEEMRQVRGGDIGMVFQEPMTSLNPVLTIGRQITETIEQHRGGDRRGGAAARGRAAGPGRHRRCRAAPAAISASALGRHAPAHHDRDRAGLRSEADHRRRADDRARRDDPGADPRIDAATDPPARRRADHHHAQSRGGRPLRRTGSM